MLATIGAILSTAAGRYAAMAVIALVLYGAGTVRGRLAGDAAHELAIAQGEAATAQADLAINTAATLAAEREAAALATTEATYADQVKSYAADVAKRPNSACALTGDDVRRLRDIR